jgi:LysM repeat protein
MSTPNPLIPQGTFQAQAARGASNVRLAVATIVAIHVVFFGGLLLQGCKRDAQTSQDAPVTNSTTTAESSTNLALPPLDSSSLYYSSSSNLPAETGSAVSAAPAGTNAFATQTPAPSAESLWQTSNLSSPLSRSGQTAGAQSSGATKEYTVVRNDNFSKIASRHHTTVSALRAANPGVDPAKIKPGDKLNVPEATPQSTVASGAPSTERVAANGSGAATTTYTVKPGDTLTKIARSHGITIKQLSSANNLRTGRITAGQKLKIPAPGPSQASTGTATRVVPPGL